jgi:hypothetical protein
VEDFGDWRRKVLLILLGNWEWRRWDCDNNISQLSYEAMDYSDSG